MRNVKIFCLIFITSLIAAGCSGGGGSSSSSGETQITSIADLPAVTGQVLDGSSASAQIMKSLGIKFGESDTGLRLGTIESDDFGGGNSVAACTAYNTATEAIENAGRSDQALCYIKSGVEAAAEAAGVDIYDGEDEVYHTFGLCFGHIIDDVCVESDIFGDGHVGEGPKRIKMKIAKNEAGAIELFEMYVCNDDDEGELYLRDTQVLEVSGNDLTVTAIGKDINDNGQTDWNHVSIIAKLDEGGNYIDYFMGEATPKIISFQSIRPENEEEESWSDIQFDQYSSSATLNGASGGVRINNEESCTFQEIMYGEMVFADFNEIGADPYLLTLLEVGDGVMKGEMIDSCNTQELPWGSPEAWLGATAVALDEVNDSDYYTDEFVAAELVDDATKPTISFPDGSWDCGSVEDEEFVIDFGAQVDAGTNIEDMCGHYNIGHDDINCSGCTMDSDCGEGQFCFYGVCLTLEGNEVGIDANSDCSESGCGGEAEACLSYFYPTCQSMCWDIETGSTKAEELAGLSIMDEEACSENSGGTWAEAAPGQYVCQPNDTVMCEAEE